MKNLEPSFLKKIPLFTGLTEEMLLKLQKIMTLQVVEAGAPIIKENEKGSQMFILLDGEVEVSRILLLKVAGQGLDQRDKLLNKLTANDHAFFGEMCLFDEDSERSASVIATTKCTLAVLSREPFFQLAETNHELGYIILKNILKIVSSRLEKTTKDVLKLTTALSLALGR